MALALNNFSIIKERKIRYLQIEINSSKFKDFTDKKNKDNLTIHNIYQEFKEYIKQYSETDEFKLDEKQTNCFIKYPGPLDTFKRSIPGLTFTFTQTKKLRKGFKLINELLHLDDFYEKVAKVRLPYTIPNDFKLPCLMIYNALLAMKNSGEDELETLYEEKEVKITKKIDKLIIRFGDKVFSFESRPKSNVLISVASNSKEKTVENSFVEGILTDSIEMEEESNKLDTSSRYIWELFDKNREFCDRIVFKREEIQWCPYDSKNLDGIYMFEIEYQKQLEIRQGLREKIKEEIKKEMDKLKQQKKKLGEKEEMKFKELEEDSDTSDDYYKKRKAVEKEEETVKEDENVKEEETENEEESKKEKAEEDSDSSDDYYKKKFYVSKNASSKRSSESDNSKISEDSRDSNNSDSEEERKSQINSNKRKVTFLKDKLIDFVFMTDLQINQKVEIGIVEATQNKKTYRVRRVGDYSIAGYEEDPLNGKRLLERSSQDDIGTKPNLSSKVNKDIDENMENFILNGAMLSTKPTKYIKKTLNTQQRVSDSKKIKEFVEQYSQYKECIIEKSKEIEDILSESNLKFWLMFKYDAKVKEDNIKTNNPWIQLPLSMIIMAKDFLYQNNYFNISGKAKDSNSPKILLYDPYWNFGQNDGLFEVESSSSEYNTIVKKQKCKLKKFQNKSLNYSYRSLVNYYHLNRTSFEVNRYLVDLDDDSIEQLEEINDMSHFLLFMTRFEISKVKKFPLKAIDSDTCLLIEKIDLYEDSPTYCIPAILPLYVIDISKKKAKKNSSSDSDEE